MKKGDRVYIDHPGLKALRDVMRKATGQEPPPNHHGTVEEMMDEDTVLIYFDDGTGSPWPLKDVHLLDEKK